MDATRPTRNSGWLLALELAAIALLTIVAIDISAHKRVEEQAGLNVWGYRGPVAHQRQPNELRIVAVGGTRAFGWGAAASGNVIATTRWQLTRTLDRPGHPIQPVVAINLGQPGALPESYPGTLEHFAYLRPDFVCIFDDLGESRTGTVEPSGIFTLTGYRPALPLVLREKGMVLRFGDVKRGYAATQRDDRAVPLPRRAAGAVLERTGDALSAADRALAEMTSSRERSPAIPSTASPDAYAEAMILAIDGGHRRARGVVVVVGPVDTPLQSRNWLALQARLAAGPQRPWLRVVDLSTREELYDPAVRLDGWNFGSGGISIASEAIAPAFLDLLAAR
jgi:hypothetical protein